MQKDISNLSYIIIMPSRNVPVTERRSYRALWIFIFIVLILLAALFFFNAQQKSAPVAEKPHAKQEPVEEIPAEPEKEPEQEAPEIAIIETKRAAFFSESKVPVFLIKPDPLTLPAETKILRLRNKSGRTQILTLLYMMPTNKAGELRGPILGRDIARLKDNDLMEYELKEHAKNSVLKITCMWTGCKGLVTFT